MALWPKKDDCQLGGLRWKPGMRIIVRERGKQIRTVVHGRTIQHIIGSEHGSTLCPPPIQITVIHRLRRKFL
jgi:hypothetical protein